MQKTALAPYAHLPRAHHHRHVLTSTVDVFGTAHWLLAERAPQRGVELLPFDALIVSVDPDGNVELTELSAVRARWPHFDRLPDGGFVVATSRTRRNEDANQVQIFDALGRETSSFSVGDAIEHLLVDESGQIWVGHFDENPAGIRRWSATGQFTWTSDGAPIPGLFDCYALNVSGTTAWACPYTDFPLVEIRPDRPDRPVRVWANRVRGAKAVAVHGERSLSTAATARSETDSSRETSPNDQSSQQTSACSPCPMAMPPAVGVSSAEEAGSTSRPSRSPRGACSTSASDAPHWSESTRLMRV
ncbi:hypothetical protein [Streptomyces sp. NPDC047024]|uniref:hypothetical protein n=1 Tax=Streptomyces sp. NPDC047024 TaxID=3155476 RepID=UPI0033ED18CC